MGKRKTKRSKAKADRLTPGIEAVETGSKVRMCHRDEKDGKLCTGIAVTGRVYKKDSQGRYLIDGAHVPMMRRQGLVLA